MRITVGPGRQVGGGGGGGERRVYDRQKEMNT